jgi:stage V sporulation protein D (sporulation-specific penicillin-binding protein)
MELLYRMWSNKAVTGLYEPGSTFKPITSTMAFEENVLNENDSFFCAGSYKVDGYPAPISCHYTSGHGIVTFARGLQQSCNPTLIQVAQRVGVDSFYDYFRSFGYTEKTGIDLPAEASPLYSAKSAFSGVSLAVYSFGQTFKVTPIQQIDALAAVANGGNLVTPHLISRILDKDGNVVYEYETNVRRSVASKDSCERVTKILEEGVSGDGGAKNCYVLGYKVAGKTGTSEKLDKYAEDGTRPYRVGSAMGYAPADDPEVIALIINDEPTKGVVYGSQVAAPYISGLLKFTLPYLNYEPEYTDTDLSSLEITISNYVGEDREIARGRLNSIEVRYEMVGEGDTVTAQIPEAGTRVLSSGARIILYFGDETPTESVSVPDLIGTTMAAASQLLENRGLNMSFTGTQSAGAIVTAQSIEEGVLVAPGTVIELTIKHTDGTD